MKYPYSALDKKNIEWFSNDVTRASLKSIVLRKGVLRGLLPFAIDFSYPITAIAGRNGTGKSTLLALSACAFHNTEKGFRLARRKNPYYTMSDFFVQSADEISVDGITVLYKILFNNWNRTVRLPNGVGEGWQARTKKSKGKWSNYSQRVNRNVVFFGIERVVPHAERSVSKSYNHYFKRAKDSGYEAKVCEIVGRILRKKYEEFWFREHSKYRLPHVKTKSGVYSGFNMGAGENAVFEIISTILTAPQGLLVVVDEIELGLHESAQRRFVKELKDLCSQRMIQVICTTHSATVIEQIPPEGRFYIDRNEEKTIITPGISSAYAAGKLAEQNSRELDIFVEDGVAKELVTAVLPAMVRRRVNIIPIGSAAAVTRQMAARYLSGASAQCIAILDGDRKAEQLKHTKYFHKMLEASEIKEDAKSWIGERLGFLPGDAWPERWIFSKLVDLDIGDLSVGFGIEADELRELCATAAAEGKHKEIHLCFPR